MMMMKMIYGGVGVGTLSASTIRPPPTTSSSSSSSKRKCSSPHTRRITCQIELKPPPYPMDALEPHMSCETLQLHWGRHHRSHVDILNRQIAGTHLDSMALTDILASSHNNNGGDAYHHAAQIWNHDFFWQSMKPNGGGRPSPSACGVLVELIQRDFGSLDAMRNQLTRAATTHFGSGWAWLLYKANRLQVDNAINPCPSPLDNKIVVTTTPNAVNPLLWDYSPLLAIDIWEHAYYLDYENRRADYVSIFMEKLVSWEVVNSRLEIAMAQATERAREEEKRREEEDAEMGNGEAMEMYLDSENDDSEAE